MSQPEKDCRACFRRRIKCDRTLPSCKKCERKGIECPQYGKPIRWVNAVALRGYSKGMKSPYVPPAGRTKKIEKPPRNEANEPCMLASIPSPPVTLLPRSPSWADPEDDETLAFYASTVAPRNVWLDSDENEYKRSIVPLAKRQPVLMTAIRAVCMTLMGASTEASDDASRTAILLLTDMIKPIVAETHGCELSGNMHLHCDHFKALLASMLVLSNHSLLSSNLSEAQSHREAARILMRVLQASKTRKDPLIGFLQNQLAAYEALACTTLFNSDHIDGAILPEQQGEGLIFGEFLHVLHRVTVLSMSHPGEAGYPESTIEILTGQFELALGSTFVAAGPLMTGQSRELREDFTRLAYLYHHAGLVYMCERLHLGRQREPWPGSARRLFEILDRFEDINTLLHNLAWPLLIAGIAATDNKMWQQKVTVLIRLLATSTGYEPYLNVLTFLEELWTDGTQDWTVLARARELGGRSIVAV